MRLLQEEVKMPKNNDLTPIEFPQKIGFDKGTSTKYKNNLSSIKVKLIQYPSFGELLKTLPKWVKATWMDNVNSTNALDSSQRWAIAWDVFHGKTLPSAKETIQFVFEIDGISLQEVTHILRHRNASFSADCSADKWWSDKDCLVPYSISNSSGKLPDIEDDDIKNFEYNEIPKDNYSARYKKLTEMCKELYAEMIDTREISILDARMILPRNLSTFYYMRMNLNDVINFIHQRIDRQIQPEADNVIAYQMYLEILRKYPIANGMIDLNEPARHYINTARSGKSSNIYPPEENSDKFEWNEKDFLYNKQRSQVCGTAGGEALFNLYFEQVIEELKKIEEKNESICKYATGRTLGEIKCLLY